MPRISPNLAQLREDLATGDSFKDRIIHEFPRVVFDRLLNAARAYADLLENGPTDEMVERAAKAIDTEVKKWPSPAPSGLIEPGWWGATTSEIARAALSAALGGET
jgi:hypothetical protein